MINHLYVKFISGGELHYGRVVTYNEEAERLVKEGKLLVADAIYPYTWVLTEDDIHDLPAEKFGEYEKFVHKMHDSALKLSNSLEGCQPGKLFHFTAYDDYAYYVVTKVGKKVCHLEWRGFSMDGYTDPVLDYKGIITRERCEELVADQDSVNKMVRSIVGD